MAVRLDHGDDQLNEVHEINVTPFIDVILVLLIIFMIAAPLATVDISVDLPSSSAERTPRPEKPLFLTLKSDLSVSLDNDTINRAALAGALARLACFCFGFFSFGGSSLGGGVTATTGSACGSGGSSIFSIGFSGCGSGSASCCSGPGATSVVMFGDTATGARSTMTTAVPATRLESSLQRANSAAAPAA